MAKTKLSISLIKEGIPINLVLKPDIPSLILANGLILYYKNNQPVCPKWVNSFLKGEYVGSESLQGKSVSAVILYQIDVDDTHRIIPFFSKVSFKSVSSKLKHYGFRVSIKGIKRTYQDDNNNDGGNEE